MKKQQKSRLLLVIGLAFVAAALLLPVRVAAEDPGQSAAPEPAEKTKTVDEKRPVWGKKLDASERFEVVLVGAAVLDKETGLVWARDANILGATTTWQDAVNYCRNLSIAGRMGWRLPAVEELASLVDPTQTKPALPAGHPFVNVQPHSYWSNTTYEGVSTFAWYVYMNLANVSHSLKSNYYYVWPVRGVGAPVARQYER